jgi:SAM-dependent methyltransferase
MNMPESIRERHQRLRQWFSTPLGRSLEAHEMHRLRDVLPQLYGTIALQLGGLGQLDLLDSSPAAKRIVLDVAADSGDVRVGGVPEQLPFETKSVHVALLPHTLDYCDDPHSVLREVARVLVPEGHVIVLGFNPVSLWGLRRLFTARPRPMPWCGNFFSLLRMKDWLALLDFEVTHGRMLYYRPPMQRENAMERMRFLDKAGDRWWPLMAGVYMVVAKKRVIGVTPLPIEWKKKSLAGAVVARPVARGIPDAGGIIIPFERRLPKQLG